MKKKLLGFLLTLPFVFSGVSSQSVFSAESGYVVEYLDRGITAVNTGSGMLVTWRYTASDGEGCGYRLYRDDTLIYESGEEGATCYLDGGGNAQSTYRVESLLNGVVQTSDECRFTANSTYFDIPLDPPTPQTSGVTYTPNDCSVGDIDGDGQYEIFLKWDPSNSKDNSLSGKTDKVYIDCLRLNGSRVWRIDLGINIRAGAHYTQFFVADFDLDGKAEMTCKTSDGSVDGQGNVIGLSGKDYRNSSGYVLTGNEYYTLFDGLTGVALDTVDYKPARGTVSSWGDSYGNRVDRFWGSVCYLDGEKPYVVTGRGYYTRLTATAYGVENKKLVEKWAYDTGNSSSVPGYGDGNHNSMVADVDGDGKQEILTGPFCIDDNGAAKWNYDSGHGDAMHLGDLLPDRPGQEIWICHEEKKGEKGNNTVNYGVSLLDAATGKAVFHVEDTGDTGRCAADNIWSGNDGAEFWGSGTNSKHVFNGSGTDLGITVPAQNFFIYWDGDLEREILDGKKDTANHAETDYYFEGRITKTSGSKGGNSLLVHFYDYLTCNTTKATPCLSADILGDWREEVILRSADSSHLRIFTTPYTTNYRIRTLMQDPQYRCQVSAQQTAYNQPPHPSFYLGSEKALPTQEEVRVSDPQNYISDAATEMNTQKKYMLKNVASGKYLTVDGEGANAVNVCQYGAAEPNERNVWHFEDAGNGYYYIVSETGNFALDVNRKLTADETNIEIYTFNNGANQKYKYSQNSDGSYKIRTGITNGSSCVEVASSSMEDGANVWQMAVGKSKNQDWLLEEAILPLKGKYIGSFKANNQYDYLYTIDEKAEVGDTVFADRAFTLALLPDPYSTAELLKTACDAKNITSYTSNFTTNENAVIAIALDSRVTNIPSWITAGGFAKTDQTIEVFEKEGKDNIVFDIYEKKCLKGSAVELGANEQSSGCVNYFVLAKGWLRGDVNKDGKLDVGDAAYILKNINNITLPNTPDFSDVGESVLEAVEVLK